MKRLLLLFAITLCFSGRAHGQTSIQSGPTNPTFCADGSLFWNTTLAARQLCHPANTWAADSGGGISSVTSLPATCTPGVTANVNLTINGTGYGEFYCGGITQAANTWVPLSTTTNGVNPIAYGARFDVRYESDCTFNSTTTVVCPKGNFTSADVGKIEFGTNALQTHGNGSLIAAPVIVPQGTISSVTNATTVVVSVIANANCTPTSSNLCWFAWGSQDDTTAIASAQTAAWVNGPCLPLILPAGAAFISKGGLGALGTGQGNACTGATDFNQSGPELYGAGQGATWLIPLTTFDFTTCTNGLNANSCFGGAGSLRIHDLQINALGQTLNTTTHANNLLEINGVTTFWNFNICTGGSASNLRLAGWGLLSTSLVGFIVNAACDVGIVNVTAEDFGNVECFMNVGGSVTALIGANDFVCFGGNTNSLSVQSGGGVWSSTGGYYGSALGNNASNILFTNTGGNGVFNSSGDVMFSNQTLGSNVLKIDSQAGSAHVNLWGDLITQQNGSAGASQAILAIGASGSIIGLTSTTINATGANNRVFNTSGTNGIYDLGGNSFTNGSLANILTGGVFGAVSITGTPITAAKLVLSAGWGASAAWTALSGATQSVQGTITNTGAGQAANPTITYTFPTPFLVAPAFCSAYQVGGTQAITAATEFLTPTSLTATGVVFTYNGTPTVNLTEVIQILCTNQ